MNTIRLVNCVRRRVVHWGSAHVVPVVVEGRPTFDRRRPPETRVRIGEPDIHRVLWRRGVSCAWILPAS